MWGIGSETSPSHLVSLSIAPCLPHALSPMRLIYLSLWLVQVCCGDTCVTCYHTKITFPLPNIHTMVHRSQINYTHQKAVAWRLGFGFSEPQARPKPSWSCQLGPAWLGLFGPGLARLTASGQARHSTRNSTFPTLQPCQFMACFTHSESSTSSKSSEVGNQNVFLLMQTLASLLFQVVI